jgi:predicted ATPase/DNA-binding SARP family transcriptional activator
LAADAWDSLHPPTPTTLQVYISKLRKVLEPERTARTPGRVLVREGTGYALRISPDQLDADKFTKLALRGRHALEQGNFAVALDLLEDALELWNGPAYADVADMKFASPEIARLTDLQVTIREAYLAALIESGHHDIAVGSLEALVSEHPLRERGWELLSLALYRSGRQADALSALRSIRHKLAEELGIDPSPTLQRVEGAILNHDASLDGQVPLPRNAQNPSIATLVERGRKAPLALTRLVGRQGELGQLRGLLGKHRIVTVSGPAGVGKTRLALEIAHSRHDAQGPFHVDLAALHGRGPLVSAVAEAFGVPGAADVTQLSVAFGQQEALLVLDNCEHLLPEVTSRTSELLRRMGGVRILVTSREPLGIAGEFVLHVPPLDPSSDGMELFQQRAAEIMPSWIPNMQEKHEIYQICRNLDGIPLAIELAAEQCRVLSVCEIRKELTEPFSLLVAGDRAVPRHRSLEGAIDLSYHLLQPDERRLFHRLAVLVGPFDLEAARAVSGCQTLFPTLASLVRKSLVMVDADSTPRRYRLLETLRQYALCRMPLEELIVAHQRQQKWWLSKVE